MLQFLELCRLCSQKKRNMLDLFAQDDEETRTLLGKISLCLSLQITREDMLPKMVCNDCQRSIEQFNTFRIKCQKAEERLNKLLAFNLPNKVLVTRIKEECLETDFQENSVVCNSQCNSPRQNEPPYINLKPVKNVKLEVYESDDEHLNIPDLDDGNANLIQVISEEIVSHNDLVDVKQPVIEIISETFVDECKNRDLLQNGEDTLCDVKLLENGDYVEEAPNSKQIFDEYINLDVERQLFDPAVVNEVKIQEPKSEGEEPHVLETLTGSDHRKKLVRKQGQVKGLGEGSTANGKSKSVKKKKRRDIVESDVEIDKRYLVLGENEVCDIDIEEMDALIKKKRDPNVRFHCKKCKKSFKFFKCLKKHRMLHENEPETFICNICCNNNAKNFEFSSLKCLKSHVQRKHLLGGGEKFKCNLCNRTLTSQGQLNAHWKKVHDNSGASCQMCGKTFKNKTRLKEHLKVHRDDRPYVCDQCGRSFKWSSGLRVHMQMHNQEKNFLCSECGKKFSTKKNLIEHLKIHSGKRSHVCKFCSATFIQLSAYYKHRYLHNEELKLHKCDKCEKAFSHSYLLKKHTLQHSGLRPFACSVCCRSFKSQSSLCTHSKSHQEKRYPCSVCGRKFSRSNTLKDHMVRHTGIKHVCPAPGCGKSYTQRFPLTKHFCKSHPSLRIINRRGGKKAHLGGKPMNGQEEPATLDCIRYDYRTKEDWPLPRSPARGEISIFQPFSY